MCFHTGETRLGMHGSFSKQLRSMQTLSSVLLAAIMPETRLVEDALNMHTRKDEGQNRRHVAAGLHQRSPG